MLAALYVPPASPDEHVPVQLIFEEHGTPADVCWGCSNMIIGHLVPVSQCAVALVIFDESGPSSFVRWMNDE